MLNSMDCLNLKIIYILIIGMSIITIVYGVQAYVTFQVNSERLVESEALRNQVLASNLIQNLDLFIEGRMIDFQSLEKAKEIRDILKSSNEEFSQIEDLDEYLEQKNPSIENFDRYLPFITQAVEQKHQNELTAIIKNYDQTYGFDFAEEFFVTNAYGANVVLIFGVADYVQTDKEWWQKTKDAGAYVGEIEYFPAYGTYAVPLGISISNESEEFLGNIRVLISIDHLLEDFFKNIQLLEEQNKEVILLNSDGMIIYHNKIIYGENLKVNFMENLTEEEGNFKFSRNDSKEIISYAKSKESSGLGLGWIVILTEKEENIISSLEDVRNSLALPAIIGALVTVIIGIIITVFVSNPLTKITKTYKQLSSGNFDVRLEPSKLHEINLLSNSYNDLSKSLKKLIETEKDLAEERVKVKNERLTAIGELSASMAHDMKNPLAVIKTATDVLKRKFKGDDEKIDKLFSNIDIGINRISHQIKDVLEYVRITPANIKAVRLDQMINTALNTIQIPPNLTIKNSQTNIELNCDQQKMEIVLINLILNAVQAIGDNSGEISITSKEDNLHYEINIENSGPPIPEELADKIFEPLFTTKFQGTGLGLATCKNIIEQHGGSILVKNNPTTFTIQFPKDVKVDFENGGKVVKEE
jgi:signal transduction histidine kinase